MCVGHLGFYCVTWLSDAGGVVPVQPGHETNVGTRSGEIKTYPRILSMA